MIFKQKHEQEVVKTFHKVGKASWDLAEGSVFLAQEKREVWRAAARCMALRDQQKQALIRLRQIFLSKQKSLVDERLRAIQAMHEAIPNPASSHDIANQFLKVTLYSQTVLGFILKRILSGMSPLASVSSIGSCCQLYPCTILEDTHMLHWGS